MFSFYSPYNFLLLPLLLFVFLKRNKKKSIEVPSRTMFQGNSTKISIKYYLGKFLIFTSLVLMIFALARPVKREKHINTKIDALDIVLVYDISLSMLADDIKPNRLLATKEVMKSFINKRPNDRIGLVVFAGTAYTRVPLSFDHNVLIENIDYLTVEDIGNNRATAIGLGIASGLSRLRNSTSKNKIIIMLSDGENNAGEISPLNATNLAKELGVKIYTVGIGSEYMNVHGILGSRKVANTEIDEKMLEEIASSTGGSYFRAKDKNTLEDIFKEIDSLERTQIDARQIQKITELYRFFLIPAIFLLLLGYYFDKYKYIILP